MRLKKNQKKTKQKKNRGHRHMSTYILDFQASPEFKKLFIFNMTY